MAKWRFVNLGKMFLFLLPCLTFDVALCQRPDTSTDSSVVFKNIGIKLCQYKCIQSGFCRALKYTISTLTCQLSEVDHNTITNEDQHVVRAKGLANVRVGSCQLKTCPNMRCLETRTGKPECVKEKWNRTKVYTELKTTLFEACIMGDSVQVRNILSHGWENVNSIGKDNMTPVMHAAKEGHREVFDLLVKEGVNLSLLDDQNRNILHFACIGGNLEIVKYVLLQKIGDIDTRDVHGWTPVFHAANVGNKDAFDVLVEAGASLSLIDGRKRNILHLACKGGNVEIIKYLLKYNIVDIDGQCGRGRTPIMLAAFHGHNNVFDILVDEGANLLLVTYRKNTILHMACGGGNVEILQYLLTQNIVDIDNQDIKGWSPVMHAAYYGHNDVFDVVADKGANLLLVDDEKQTILHVACVGGNVEIIKYLLTQDIVDIDNQDMDEWTPVMRAAYHGHMDAVDFLVKSGANLSLVNYEGKTVLHSSCAGENVDILRYLLANENMDINIRDGNGLTPVMQAAMDDCDDMFHFLVKWGADLRLLDEDNNNILHLACHGGDVEIVKYLLTHNIVDINSRDGDGCTPAMIAALDGNEAIFFLLVDHEADLTPENDAGDNILNLACEGENEHILKYLSTRHILEGQYNNDDPC